MNVFILRRPEVVQYSRSGIPVYYPNEAGQLEYAVITPMDLIEFEEFLLGLAYELDLNTDNDTSYFSPHVYSLPELVDELRHSGLTVVALPQRHTITVDATEYE